MARFETRRGTFLPPRYGAPLGIHEPLLENVVEDVLEVKQLRGVADVDKLRGHLPMHTRRLVVRDPKIDGRSTVTGNGSGHFGRVEGKNGRNSRSWGARRRRKSGAVR
jgi:hypothetical protein